MTLRYSFQIRQKQKPCTMMATITRGGISPITRATSRGITLPKSFTRHWYIPQNKITACAVSKNQTRPTRLFMKVWSREYET